MEEAWGMEGGMEREGSHNMWNTMPRGESPRFAGLVDCRLSRAILKTVGCSAGGR